MIKRISFLVVFILVVLVTVSHLHSEIVAKLAAVDPSTQQVAADALAYQGPCPVTIKFVGRIGSSESVQIQYRILRSDNAITPVKSVSVEAGKSQAVETSWTIAGNISGWMEIEVLSPLALKSNRAEFKVNCSPVAVTSAAKPAAAPVAGTVSPQQKPQEAAPPARPAGKAIAKEKAELQVRPAGKAVPVAAALDPGRATYFVANDQSGSVTIFDARGTKVRTFQAKYTSGDGFGVGDVDGDGTPEIVMAGDVHGRVRIYKQSGELAGDFDGQFSKNDGFAVGDVNGDRADEIIIAGDKDGIIDIFTWTGQKIRSFYGRFTKNDALDAGDVNGDGIDEILHHGDRWGRVNAYNIQGGTVVSFNSGLSSGKDAPRDSGIGAGDVNGDRLSEIVVAFIVGEDKNLLDTDFYIPRINIYDRSGKRLKEIHAFTLGDTFRVGDVTGDGVYDIVVAGDVHHSVHVFDKDGVQIMTFLAGYTKKDGFAIARRR